MSWSWEIWVDLEKIWVDLRRIDLARVDFVRVDFERVDLERLNPFSEWHTNLWNDLIFFFVLLCMGLLWTVWWFLRISFFAYSTNYATMPHSLGAFRGIAEQPRSSVQFCHRPEWYVCWDGRSSWNTCSTQNGVPNATSIKIPFEKASSTSPSRQKVSTYSLLQVSQHFFASPFAGAMTVDVFLIPWREVKG